MSPNTATRTPTIVVTDAYLQHFTAQKGIARFGHSINDRGSVQSNHLLEVDVSAIDAVYGQTEELDRECFPSKDLETQRG